MTEPTGYAVDQTRFLLTKSVTTVDTTENEVLFFAEFEEALSELDKLRAEEPGNAWILAEALDERSVLVKFLLWLYRKTR